MPKGTLYEKFIDYKSNTSSDRLPIPSTEFWHTLWEFLTKYVRYTDSKFDYYNEGIAHRNHVMADRIRYICKETNNIDETRIIGLNEDSCLEYENLREFYYWVLNLKPKVVRYKGMSRQVLYEVKTKIKSGKHLNPRVEVVKILLKLHGDLKTDSGN